MLEMWWRLSLESSLGSTLPFKSSLCTHGAEGVLTDDAVVEVEFEIYVHE